MGLGFRSFRFARQFRADLRTLFHRPICGGPSLSDRLLALDRIAGSVFLLCVVLSAMWLASQMLPARTLPPVAESAQAATAAPELGPQRRIAEAATRPMTADEIRKVQNWLEVLGFDPGPVDGMAGPRTLRAFNQYRASKSLDPVSRIDRANAAELLD